MKIDNQQTDHAILLELGTRIAEYRLELALTQAELAQQAGISKPTIERVESGASAQMTSIIRILRALKLLAHMDHVIPEPGQKPMDLLKRKSKKRQRAPSKAQSKKQGKPWSWDDDA